MASSTSSVSLRSQSRLGGTPVWLWPNLLSLDAPLIASLWQRLFAQQAGVTLSLASQAILPMAVWLIYLLDRMMDTSGASGAGLTARHRFCCEHRPICWALVTVAGLGSMAGVYFLPRPVFWHGAAVFAFVIAYLLIVHACQGSVRRWLPKEAAVGLLFAVGTVLAPFTWSAHPSGLLFPALLFGILCWANTAAIEWWEGGRLDAVSHWTVRHLRLLSAVISCLCLVHGWASPLDIALLLTALGYGVVDFFRPEMQPDLLRVAIDVPLLAPLLLSAWR